MEKILPSSPCNRWLLVLGFALVARIASSQGAPLQAERVDAPADVKSGVVLDVTLPLTSRSAVALMETLLSVAEQQGAQTGDASRYTVVLRFRADSNDGATTAFEDALKLARSFSKTDFRRLRIVSYLEGDLRGHAVLPVLASDLLVITDSASLGDAAQAEPEGTADATVIATYQAIAARRALFPPAVVEALVNRRQELVLATTLDGKRRFASGEELQSLRREGGGWQEEVWAAAGQSLILDSERLKSARFAAHVVPSFEQLPQVLELAKLTPLDDQIAGGSLAAGILEVSGAISKDRVRRWELNIAKATDAGEINTAIVVIDSSGGDLNASLQLAGTLSSTQPPLQRAIGFVLNQSRGDSALIATACKPLYLAPDAKLGGPGGQAMSRSDLRPNEEALEQIALDSGRPLALLKGLLDPSLKVFRYTNTKTGQVRYATEDEMGIGGEEPEAERLLWRRGESIALDEGLSSSQAIELGLAEGQASSIEEIAATLGLEDAPQPITDRGLIHFVEWVGGLKGVSIFLLMIGMVALSMEAGAPGLSVPGFVSLICFAAYFWIQFLNGTAQWLEILAFALGLVCIAIELFVLPGVGVFGIGGLCLLVLGVVLTSQTFVIPRNTYQFEQLTRNLWLVVGGFGAVIVGLTLLRIFVPQAMILKHLALEIPDDESIDRAERLTDYEYLLGESGVATTPLRPAGKARFGDDIVHVISNGTPVGPGDSVTVIEVRGNRIVVELTE
jgi:membrane-bound serine protease (ClpP class)